MNETIYQILDIIINTIVAIVLFLFACGVIMGIVVGISWLVGTAYDWLKTQFEKL